VSIQITSQSDAYIGAKITAAQVYRGSTERRFWP